MNPVVEIAKLQFRYPSREQTVLQIAQFTLQKNEKIFLYGPSGTGKTTFLELIAGVLTPTAGKVQVLGKDLSTLSASERDRFRGLHVGYIFQSFNLIPYLSVRENIELPTRLLPERKKASPNLSEDVQFLTERLGIVDLLDEPVTELSVGQSQRVAVARALLGRPELILADEPTSSLDSDHREKFIELLFELCQKFSSSVLFVSHDRSMEKLFSRSVSLSEINKASQR